MSMQGTGDKLPFAGATFNVSAAGIITVASGSVNFTTFPVKPGDSFVAASTEHIVVGITDATHLQTSKTSGVTVQTGVAGYLQQKPKWIQTVAHAPHVAVARADVYAVGAAELTAARNAGTRGPCGQGWVKTIVGSGGRAGRKINCVLSVLSSPPRGDADNSVWPNILPVITWANPASISHLTALSGTQLNATAAYGGNSVAGVFVYTPASGTTLSAGTQTLSVTFTPTDTTTYQAVTKTASIVIT